MNPVNKLSLQVIKVPSLWSRLRALFTMHKLKAEMQAEIRLHL